MSVFDVHINRAPISGTGEAHRLCAGQVHQCGSRQGKRGQRAPVFPDRRRRRAEDRHSRRLPAWSRVGSCPSFGKAMRSMSGQRIGLIRFGSRVDVYLPAGHVAARVAWPARDRRRNDARRSRPRRSGDRDQPVIDDREPRGIPFRAMIPNMITALALCFGLTGVSLAIGGALGKGDRRDRPGRRAGWSRRPDRAVASGAKQIRRRAGFAQRQYCVRHRTGVDPVLVVAADGASVRMDLPRSRLPFAARCGSRDSMPVSMQPSSLTNRPGFNTGVPAPAGAGLAFMPIYLWLITGDELFRAVAASWPGRCSSRR